MMRLLDPTPKSTLLKLANEEFFAQGEAVGLLHKAAGDASTSYGMTGRLVASSSGWLLLEVPNALVRGAFEALTEPGIELPPSGSDGKLNAHISVMRPDDVEQIGGINKITERGKQFSYTLGPLQTTSPAGWAEMSKVWFIKVISPELKNLRKSYGLTPLPKNNEYDFHISVAVRRKGVMGRNSTSKSEGKPDTVNFDDVEDHTLKVGHVGGGAIKAERTQSVVGNPEAVAARVATDGKDKDDPTDQIAEGISALFKGAATKVPAVEANFRPAGELEVLQNRICTNCSHYLPDNAGCSMVEVEAIPEGMTSNLFEAIGADEMNFGSPGAGGLVQPVGGEIGAMPKMPEAPEMPASAEAPKMASAVGFMKRKKKKSGGRLDDVVAHAQQAGHTPGAASGIGSAGGGSGGSGGGGM